MTTNMKPFHNKPKLKKMLLIEIEKHQKADEIAQGSYGGENGPWCAVGCAIHSLNVKLNKTYPTGDHSVYETELGIPRVIAKLEDTIFEGLAPKEAKEFPYKFISAIPVGADLSLVWPKLALWFLTDKLDGVLQYAKTDKTKEAIENVGKLYARVVLGEIVSIAERKVARDAANAAYTAAYTAADAAAATAAATAADAAAATAAATAADAAYTATYAAAASAATYAAAATAAARRKYYSKLAKKLIELVKECK
jgi:hypothetical protein